MGRWGAVVLAAGFFWLATPQTPQAQVMNFGESLVLNRCLLFTAISATDKSGGIDHYDWITLKLSNKCRQIVKNLRVAVYLLDGNGNSSGMRIWMLARGEMLRPGGSKLERYPIQDRNNLTPKLWSIRLIQVDGV